MTDKPNHKQIQQACDLLHGEYCASSYGRLNYNELTALADTIAKLDAMQAERDKARADLGEISRLLDQPMVNSARAIAAPYRVETDPLVAAISAAIGEYIMPGAPWDKLRAELAKRGLEIGRQA